MTSSHRPALGRGLSALIPKTNNTPGIETVDIDLVVPNPEQPRMSFDQDALRELADSIREHGVLQPLIVTAVQTDLGPTTYQLIAGERRLQAARQAGIERIPVVIREAAGRELLEIALIENIQREDLNPIEESQAFTRLANDYGMTQDDIAKRIGRSRSAVTNTMRLMLLEEDIRASLLSGQITEGHARSLLHIDDRALRLDTWRKIVSDGLNVRQVEEIARLLRETHNRAPSTVPQPTPAAPVRGHSRLDPHVRALEDDLRSALGAYVSLQVHGSGGRIIIRFHSPEELDGIIERITRG
jgi:ParB family chromosome partitioning protein